MKFRYKTLSKNLKKKKQFLSNINVIRERGGVRGSREKKRDKRKIKCQKSLTTNNSEPPRERTKRSATHYQNQLYLKKKTKEK